MFASYFGHPAMPPFIEFMQNVYKDIGIELKVQPYPATRGILMLNEGLVDADIMRVGDLAKDFDNIIVLEPAIYSGKVVLVCNTGLLCSTDTLLDEKNYIMTTGIVRMLLKGLEIKANLQSLENIETSLEMLKMGRVDYMIMGTTSKHMEEIAKEYSVIPLKEVYMHHVIHKKHQSMRQIIEKALQDKISTFNPDSNLF